MSAPGIVGIGGAETNHRLNKPEQILLPDSYPHAQSVFISGHENSLHLGVISGCINGCIFCSDVIMAPTPSMGVVAPNMGADTPKMGGYTPLSSIHLVWLQFTLPGY